MDAPNNSFNRSGVTLSFIENLSHDVVVSRPVNSGVTLLYGLICASSTKDIAEYDD